MEKMPKLEYNLHKRRHSVLKAQVISISLLTTQVILQPKLNYTDPNGLRVTSWLKCLNKIIKSKSVILSPKENSKPHKEAPNPNDEITRKQAESK